MRLAWERRVSGNCEPLLGLSIGFAKTPCRVSCRHCTFRDWFIAGCKLMPPPHIFWGETCYSIPSALLTALSSTLLPHTQPSSLPYVISASHFLTGNILYWNVRRWQASKQARTLHVLQSNPFWFQQFHVFHPSGWTKCAFGMKQYRAIHCSSTHNLLCRVQERQKGTATHYAWNALFAS